MANNYTKLIKEYKEENEIDNLKKIKIAILSSYTINNLKDPLTYILFQKGFNSEIKFGGYEQYNQELMNKESWLHEFNPDIIIVAINTKTFFPNLNYEVLEDNFKDIENKYKEKIENLIKSINSYNKQAKIFLTTLDYPITSPYSIEDLTKEEGIYSTIKSINNILIKEAKENPTINLIDFDRITSIIGKTEVTDNKMYYMGKIILSNKASEIFAREISNYINASYGNIKKCIIVDLDNTLWSGVIGEDGVEGIIIDDSPIGSIHKDIQKILLNYKKKGILLAIVSKNNLNDVMPVFKSNKMILKENDFVTHRINWEPKSKNIESIAKELNLGLQSFMFLDDNPAERLEVKSRLKMVEIIDFPKDIANLPDILNELENLKSISLTEEDKKRHVMYLEDKKRKELETNTESLDDYLSELEIVLEIRENDFKHVDRITQLINKTNQFNLRTIRLTKEEVIAMFNSKNTNIYSINVKDKFGELGLTGICIIEEKEKEYFVLNFLLSCRILSRGIEKQFFYEIFKKLNKNKDVIAEYIKTPKNSMVSEFYETLDFKVIKENENMKTYKLNSIQCDYKDMSWLEVKWLN